MNRKWKVILLILSVLIVLIILIWPMAPLWQRLGLEMICIQGRLPNVHLVPCSNRETGLPTPGISFTEDNLQPIPIIVDDDGSPDGTIAILYFLQNPRFDVIAITVSYGEAHPEVFSQHVAKILLAMGRSDVPVGYGQDVPLKGNNAFPDSWRQSSDDFWGVTIPQTTGMTAPVPAVDLIVESISNSEKPVTIFVSGSHTNLAQALQLDPGITENIADVFIMGGSVYQPGNIHSDWPEYENEVAEWNIWVDPLAASEVFSSGLNLHLVPLDATHQVAWTKRELTEWRAAGWPEGELAADIAQNLMNAWGVDSMYIWDLVAAVQTTCPGVCPETAMALDIVLSSDMEQGRTQRGSGEPNVAVCLNPDAGQIKSITDEVFKQSWRSLFP